MPSCGLSIVSHGASPNDPPDAYEGVRCGSFASKGLPSCVPGWCRKTAERTVPDMAKTNTMTANVSKELRKEVYRRDGFRCALCDSTDGLQIHHVKPRGQGGADHPMNLITLCWRCHAAAHGSILLLDEYPSHDEFPNIEQQIQAMKDDLELACVEYVSDYYAERGEIWYPWEG